MRKVLLKNEVLFTVVPLVSIFLLSCGGYLKEKHMRPMTIKNAAVGLNFATGGKVTFVDQDGTKIPQMDFKRQLDSISKKVPDWKLEKVQTINVYHIKGSHFLVFEIDGEGVCLKYSDAWVYEGPC